MDPVITPPPEISPKPQFKFSTLFLGITIGIVFTIISIFVVLLVVNNRPVIPYISSIPTIAQPSPYVQSANIPTTPLVNSPINPGAVTWLDFPKVTKLDVFTPEAEFPVVSSAIQTATFADGSKLVNATITQDGPGQPFLERYVITPSGQIYYLSAYNGTDQYYLSNLKTGIKISDFKIDGINTADTIITAKGAFISTSIFGNNIMSFTQVKNPQFLVDSDYGRFYVTYSPKKDLASVSLRQIWLRLKDDTVVPYQNKLGFITTDLAPQVTWSDNSKNTQAYNAGFRGQCGIVDGNVVKPDPNPQDLAVSGTTSENQSVYRLTDSSNPILKYIYSLLNNGDVPSYDSFVKSNYHFLWKDTIGDWEIFISQENQIQAECGKPVIYLYPQKDTLTTVKVAANITKSDPLYPAGGWTVLAHPNGQLDYQGQTYPSLFWEGFGLGQYPDLTGYGFVVSQKDLIPTLKSQLKQQGLNSQESSDFLDFWTSRLPQTPFVRLTWLGTKEMNQLAPLQVTPAPNTTIRVFLDFAGLDQPIKLIPQHLSSPPRRGFTLVEWGGLLVN